MDYVEHNFGPKETIQAIIRRVNDYDLDQEDMDFLDETFNRLNGEVVPRLGQLYKIPLYEPLVEPEVEIPSAPTTPIIVEAEEEVTEMRDTVSVEEQRMLNRQARRERARLKAQGIEPVVIAPEEIKVIEPAIPDQRHVVPIPEERKVTEEPKKKRRKVVPVNPVVKDSETEDNSERRVGHKTASGVKEARRETVLRNRRRRRR